MGDHLSYSFYKLLFVKALSFCATETFLDGLWRHSALGRTAEVFCTRGFPGLLYGLRTINRWAYSAISVTSQGF